MQELHGVTGKPYNTPQVRKKMPAPFSRDRIDLDGGSRVKRSWKDTAVVDLKQGDTVAGFGVIASAAEIITIPTAEQFSGEVPGRPFWRIRLINVLGEDRDFPGEQRVFAFSAETAQ